MEPWWAVLLANTNGRELTILGVSQAPWSHIVAPPDTNARKYNKANRAKEHGARPLGSHWRPAVLAGTFLDQQSACEFVSVIGEDTRGIISRASKFEVYARECGVPCYADFALVFRCENMELHVARVKAKPPVTPGPIEQCLPPARKTAERLRTRVRQR